MTTEWRWRDVIQPGGRKGTTLYVSITEVESRLTAIRQHIASLPEQEETEWVKELRRIVNE